MNNPIWVNTMVKEFVTNEYKINPLNERDFELVYLDNENEDTIL